MSDRAQQSILQELERLLPHIRRLEVENKATADEKAATTEASIGEQLAKVIARDAALQRETEQQRAARERVAAATAAPIIKAIRAAPQAAKKAVAEAKTKASSRPAGLPAKREFLKQTPEAARAYAENIGLDVGRSTAVDGIYRKVYDHLRKLGPSPSYESAEAQLAARDEEPLALVGDKVGSHPAQPAVEEEVGSHPAQPAVEEEVGSHPAQPAVEEEEFSTPKSAQRTRAEGSGVKRGRTQRRDPLDLLERIHGEILAGNCPLAAETVRLGTNAVRTLVRRGELSADEGQMIVAELRAAAI